MPRARAPRLDGWTPDRRQTFLENLRRGHSIRAAAEAAGLSRQSVNRLRARDLDFAADCEAAIGHANDVLLPDLLDRALHGKRVRRIENGRLVEVADLDVGLAIRLMRAFDARLRPPPRVASAGNNGTIRRNEIAQSPSRAAGTESSPGRPADGAEALSAPSQSACRDSGRKWR